MREMRERERCACEVERLRERERSACEVERREG